MASGRGNRAKAAVHVETLTPDQVIDEVERCLELGKPFAYPGKQTKFGVIMRRLFPGVVWKASHDAEGF